MRDLPRFLDLALRKTRDDGTIALVLPLSAVSGSEWDEARKTIVAECSRTSPL